MNKKTLIITGIIIAIVILILVTIVSTNNRAIVLEEQVYESQSSIEVYEKRRIDLLFNLVDAIESYNNYEGDILVSVTEARSDLEYGDIESASMAINAVAEAYPELQSIQNYQTYMTELSMTENQLAQYRENYNNQVKSYNKFCRKLQNKFFLSISGYEILKLDYLEYNAPSDAPQDLFGD